MTHPTHWYEFSRHGHPTAKRVTYVCPLDGCGFTRRRVMRGLTSAPDPVPTCPHHPDTAMVFQARPVKDRGRGKPAKRCRAAQGLYEAPGKLR